MGRDPLILDATPSAIPLPLFVFFRFGSEASLPSCDSEMHLRSVQIKYFLHALLLIMLPQLNMAELPFGKTFLERRRGPRYTWACK